MTVQIKDTIVYKGVKYALYTYPLEKYWNKRRQKPQIRPACSNCWRGYVATWEIFENDLYLTDIKYHACVGDIGLEQLFPGGGEGVRASWFTGELCIPQGDFLDDMLCVEFFYDYDLFIYIKKGEVKSHRFKANY